MNYEEADVLLTEYGWTLECWSPFEISLEGDPESRATGYAAQLVLDQIEQQAKRKVQRKAGSGCGDWDYFGNN